VPIALEKKSFMPSLEMCAEFVRQRREDRNVPISLAFGMGDVDLGRMALSGRSSTRMWMNSSTRAPV
jgi:hypothetical protein